MQIPSVRSHGHLPVSPARFAPTASETIQLDILHVNDMHGFLEPTKDPKGPGMVGGLPRVKTVIDRARADNPEGTLVLNAGDIAEGTMVSYLTRGRSVAEALRAFDFDALALGNHDFAWGQAALGGMMGALGCPILAANVVKTSDGTVMDGAQPYLVKDVKGVKVGIIGLDTPAMRHYVAEEKLQGLDFLDGVGTVQKYLPEVRAKGAEVVVVLSHMGFEEDCKLAKAVPGLDVIVGGHSHTELHEGHREGDTLIVQAGGLTKFVGRATLEFDPATRRVVGQRAQLIPVKVDGVHPDAEVQAIIAPYLREAQQVGARVMGHAEADLPHAHREAAKLNQIHADSILRASGAEFGICNSRTLRANVREGDVTYQDLYSALPFTEENYVVMRARGSQVLAEIEDDLRDKATELAVPAGLSYAYDPQRPEGQRVVSATLADGKPLDPDKEYTIVLNETMSRKPAFKDTPRKVLGPVQPLFFEAFGKGSPWQDDPDARVRKI